MKVELYNIEWRVSGIEEMEVDVSKKKKNEHLEDYLYGWFIDKYNEVPTSYEIKLQKTKNMSETMKKEELVNNGNQPQYGKLELMGIPSNPNEHLSQLLDNLNFLYGEDIVNLQIQRDGLPIFLQKILIGNMSSSILLKQLVNKYGFEEVQNDLNWLKEIEKDSLFK